MKSSPVSTTCSIATRPGRGAMKRQVALLAMLVTAIVIQSDGSGVADGPSSGPVAGNERLGLARPSGQVSIQAAGRGNPAVNLTDGRDVLTSFVGEAELVQALSENRAQGLSLASADFDEDGVPDLVSGYACASGGIITIHRGNVDSIYPNSPEAKRRKAEGTFTDAPFLSPASVFAVSESADLIGAGDFDGDSHLDVVAARRGGTSLHLLSGDGRGGLIESRAIELREAVTAMVTGEINRRDGLDDVVVGVVGKGGAKALVFEGPQGALRADPESFVLPDEAATLALGQLDDSYEMDLAVAAGKELVIVHGRDRKLSLDEKQKSEALAATIARRSFDFTIRSIVIGDFTGGNESDLALLSEEGEIHLLSKATANDQKQVAAQSVAAWESEKINGARWPAASRIVRARLSSLPKDDLVAIDSLGRGLHIISQGSGIKSQGSEKEASATDHRPLTTDPRMASLDVEGEPAAVMPMRLNTDALSDLVILRNGSSALSVAMTQPSATFTVTNTNVTGPGSLLFAILDANETPGVDLIDFNIPGAGPHVISPTASLPGVSEPVTIDGTTQPGFAGSPIIELNGGSAGPGPNGLEISAGNSVVRGLSVHDFKLSVSGGGVAIQLANIGNNLIESNFIGLESAGVGFSDQTQIGVLINNSTNNTIGGTATAARNLISRNAIGVQIVGSATGIQILGNIIGPNITGTQAAGQGSRGCLIESGSNTIGGTVAGARNVISAGHDLSIEIRSNGNLIQGNLIGPDPSGTARVAGICDTRSCTGILIEAIGSGNTIGGMTASARNIISGNSGEGVDVRLSQLNLVQGNFIGTDITGAASLRNFNNGVLITGGSNNAIGGAVSGAGNIISNNTLNGISITGTSTNNQIQGNLIGTDVTGSLDFSNTQNGITITDSSSGNLIGGTTPEARNIISGNGLNGVLLDGAMVTSNTVQGNFIGTNSAGTAALGNDLNGVATGEAPNNLIGGPQEGARNIISANGRHGVSIGINTQSGATGISVEGNFIGTAVNGVDCLGNFRDGIFVNLNSVGHTIRGNVIACNGRNGVNVPNFINSNPGIRISLQSNRVFSNSNLGIDIGNTGVTGNDAGDGDVGANNLQNFPILTSVTSTGGNTQIVGSLSSTPNTNFYIQFFAGPQCVNSNPGQGQQVLTLPILFATGPDNGSPYGVAPIDLTLTNTPVSGWVNCVARDPSGNTSEFSSCALVNGGGSCSYSILPAGQSFPSNGGTGSVAVTAGASCNWTAVSQDSFIIITSGIDGTGNGTVNYQVAANMSGASRTGTMTIAGQAFTVTQDGASSCTFSLSSSGQSFGAGGGSGSFNVTTQGGCNWSPIIDVGWATASRAGGTVNYLVESNSSGPRTGHITVEDQVYTLTQDGAAVVCSYMLSPTSASVPSSGGIGGFNLTTAPGCSWNAAADVAWIIIPTNGTGSTAINYTVAANTGPARSGMIFIEGQAFTINQDASCLSISPGSRSFAANGGSGNINVTASTGCAWTSVSNNPEFITITSGASGTGSGAVSYSVASNPATTIRSGTISVEGHTFIVYQGASFLDVPETHLFYNEIGKLASRGVTLGCGGGNYCPEQAVTREQMSAFIIRALGVFTPPQPPSQRFMDVLPQNPFYAFIEQMAVRQITLGCGGGNYCPTQPVLREQMAAFIIRGLGEFNPPVPGSQRFNDVPPSNPFYNFIDRMAALGITSGCSASPPLYCPGATVTRGQMAVFLVRAFNL
jgi:all-beta uncharacterized protein/S-layer family protein